MEPMQTVHGDYGIQQTAEVHGRRPALLLRHLQQPCRQQHLR